MLLASGKDPFSGLGRQTHHSPAWCIVRGVNPQMVPQPAPSYHRPYDPYRMHQATELRVRELLPWLSSLGRSLDHPRSYNMPFFGVDHDNTAPVGTG